MRSQASVASSGAGVSPKLRGQSVLCPDAAQPLMLPQLLGTTWGGSGDRLGKGLPLQMASSLFPGLHFCSSSHPWVRSARAQSQRWQSKDGDSNQTQVLPVSSEKARWLLPGSPPGSKNGHVKILWILSMQSSSKSLSSLSAGNAGTKD